MAPLMKIQFKKLLGSAVEELEHFIKHGQPHPSKVTFDALPKAQKARAAAAHA